MANWLRCQTLAHCTVDSFMLFNRNTIEKWKKKSLNGWKLSSSRLVFLFSCYLFDSLPDRKWIFDCRNWEKNILLLLQSLSIALLSTKRHMYWNVWRKEYNRNWCLRSIGIVVVNKEKRAFNMSSVPTRYYYARSFMHQMYFHVVVILCCTTIDFHWRL